MVLVGVAGFRATVGSRGIAIAAARRHIVKDKEGAYSRATKLVKASRRCQPKETLMTWNTPIVCEVSVGMEVTSYESADDSID